MSKPALQVMPPPKFLSGADLALRYRRTRRTIDRWIADSEFPAPALTGPGVTSLWHTSDVEAWEAEYFTKPKQAQ